MNFAHFLKSNHFNKETIYGTQKFLHVMNLKIPTKPLQIFILKIIKKKKKRVS